MKKIIALMIIGTVIASNPSWSKTEGSEKAISQVNSTVDFGEEKEMQPVSSGKSESTHGLQGTNTNELKEQALEQNDSVPRRTH